MIRNEKPGTGIIRMNKLEIVDNVIGEVVDDKNISGCFRAAYKNNVALCSQNHPALRSGNRNSSGRQDDKLVHE